MRVVVGEGAGVGVGVLFFFFIPSDFLEFL